MLAGPRVRRSTPRSGADRAAEVAPAPPSAVGLAAGAESIYVREQHAFWLALPQRADRIPPAYTARITAKGREALAQRSKIAPAKGKRRLSRSADQTRTARFATRISYLTRVELTPAPVGVRGRRSGRESDDLLHLRGWRNPERLQRSLRQNPRPVPPAAPRRRPGCGSAAPASHDRPAVTGLSGPRSRWPVDEATAVLRMPSVIAPLLEAQRITGARAATRLICRTYMGPLGFSPFARCFL